MQFNRAVFTTIGLFVLSVFAQEADAGNDACTSFGVIDAPLLSRTGLVRDVPVEVAVGVDIFHALAGKPKLQVLDSEYPNGDQWTNVASLRRIGRNSSTEKTRFKGIFELTDTGEQTTIQRANDTRSLGRSLIVGSPATFRLISKDKQDVTKCYVSPNFSFLLLEEFTDDEGRYSFGYPPNTIVFRNFEANPIQTGVLSTVQLRENFDDMNGITVNTIGMRLDEYVASLSDSLVETNRESNTVGRNSWIKIAFEDVESLRASTSFFLELPGITYQVVSADGVNSQALEQVIGSFSVTGVSP